MRFAASIALSLALSVSPVWADPIYDAAIENYVEKFALQSLDQDENQRSAACFVDLLNDDERLAIIDAQSKMEMYGVTAHLNGGPAANCEIAIWEEAGLL